MFKYLKFIIILLSFSGFFSCSILNKSRMLKTPINYEFDTVKDSLMNEEYYVDVDDEISLQLFSNNGFSIIRLGQGGGNQGGGAGGNQGGGGQNGQIGMFFKVRPDSTIKIPVIGNVKVVGLNITQLEELIESKLTNQFKDPFVIARISNRRIFVFKSGNSSSIYQLQNQNTTLFEVLAATGGIPNDGNASRIKIIRGNPNNPEIFLIDLSRIDGIKDANIIMQAGDIVYVDPFLNYANFIVQDISLVLGLLSSVLLVYTLLVGGTN